MWLTALLLGFAGSLHCLGMCSPLVIAVTNFRGPFLFNRVLYNVARLFTYGVMGSLVAAFGSLFNFTGFQNVLSIALGAGLIVIGLSGVNYIRIPLVTNVVQKGSSYIKNVFSTTIKEKSVLSFAVLGALNGMLPCGLTYLALTYCLTMPGGFSGFLFMILFGIGTLPVMLGFTSVLKYLVGKYRFSLQRFSMIAMIFLGVLLIARITLGKHLTNSNASFSDGMVICK